VSVALDLWIALPAAGGRFVSVMWNLLTALQVAPGEVVQGSCGLERVGIACNAISIAGEVAVCAMDGQQVAKFAVYPLQYNINTTN
jgi:hypothetical protein